MTDITLPRATVEQAVEALEDAKALLNNKDRTTTMWFVDEITALRAALAQQAEPVQEPITRLFGTLPVHDAQQAEPVQEPVATITECEACFTPDVCQLRGTCDHYTASQMRIAAPQQQAEPVEPAAWVGDPSTQDYASTVPDPQVEDRLARHGIPMPGDPK